MDDTSVKTNIKVNQVSSRTHFVRAGINLVDFFIGDNMKRIPLTQGQFAIVDDEDYDYLMRWKWRLLKGNNTYYAITSIYRKHKRTTESMHRMILKPKDGRWVDHKDRNGLNNTRLNIRTCSKSQNGQNKIPAKNARSKYKGVVWHERLKKWKAHIYLNRRDIYLGVYVNEQDAAKAYDTKAKELFGEFARLNFNGE